MNLTRITFAIRSAWPAVLRRLSLPGLPLVSGPIAQRTRLALLVALGACSPNAFAGQSPDYTTDGRSTVHELWSRLETLSKDNGWLQETVYAYPGANPLTIRAWRTPRPGAALWIISGIHGEEPAGPNAITRNLAGLVKLAESGVPIVLIPLSNPQAYQRNWRYPNTSERDWHKGGYSVGDAEHLLPDLEQGVHSRSPAAPGPETLALTRFVLELAKSYPPRLVLDLHEDELSMAGGYIYSQGSHADDNPVGNAIVDLLIANGIALRKSGNTRFGEPIVNGVISRDDKGLPIRDGSIDELLAATEVFVDDRKARGPSAKTVIVVETPAFAGSKFEQRVAAQGAVIKNVARLWHLNEDGPPAKP